MRKPSASAAARESASVSGGCRNTASGWASSVRAGRGNIASIDCAIASGGYSNTARGWCSSVSGGYLRQPLGEADWQGGLYRSDW